MDAGKSSGNHTEPNDNPILHLRTEHPDLITQAVNSSNGQPLEEKIPSVEIKLFVGRVPRSYDEAALEPIFRQFGPVNDVLIIKDRNSNVHKGSAFVRMSSIAHADAAIKALNGQYSLDSHLGPLQVRYATGEAEKLGMPPEAATPGTNHAKLFVGSLPRYITEEEISKLFSRCGSVEEVFIMRDPANNQGRGCAFVKMAFKEQALAAIKTLNGYQQLMNAPRALEVRFAESKKSQQQQQQHQQQQQQQQQQHNSPLYGRNSHYHHQSAPDPAHANSNPRSAGPWKEYFTEDGRPYYHNEISNSTQWEKPTEFDRPDTAGPPGANVFIFHVPNDWTQQELVQNFQPFGQIVSARIATDKVSNRNRGFAFVSYSTIQSAAQAVQHMNGFLAGNKRLKVSIKQNEEEYVSHLLTNSSSPNLYKKPNSNQPTTDGYTLPRYFGTTQGLHQRLEPNGIRSTAKDHTEWQAATGAEQSFSL